VLHCKGRHLTLLQACWPMPDFFVKVVEKIVATAEAVFLVMCDPSMIEL
jgi:hypothetical protein